MKQIIGESVPQVPGPPTPMSICSFAQTTSAGIDLTKPGVAVIPFPNPEQETTLSALSAELSGLGASIIKQPQWGDGAFMTDDETSQSTNVSVDLFLPGFHVLLHAPVGTIEDPEQVGEEIGNAIAGK